MIMTKKKKMQIEAEKAEAIKAAEEAKINAEKEAERLAEEKAQAEFDKKLKIKRNYNNLKKQTAKLDKYKDECIDKLVAARDNNEPDLIRVYTTCAKLALSRQKMYNKMMANFEFAKEMKEFNKIALGFIDGIQLLSQELNEIVPTVDLNKAQRAFEEAMSKNEGQMEALNEFLETASDSCASFGGVESSISDEEIDEMVNARRNSNNQLSNSELDEDIKEMNAMLSKNSLT